MLYFKKLLSVLKEHILLTILGLICELIYIVCFVWPLPLLRYYQGLTDLGYITGHSHVGFTRFIIAFTLLFIFFGFAWWDVYHSRQNQDTLWLILGFGVFFAGTMVFVYPVTAIDVFGYVVQSLILIQHHANPMITPALSFPTDPMMKLAGGWGGIATPYGPLGILIDAIPTFLVGRNLLANLLLLKGLFSTLLIFEAFLTYKIVSKYRPSFALASALFIAWNPLALFEYSANSHNDVVVMLFVLLAILALQSKHPATAFSLIVASALIKYATLPLLPLFFLYSIRHQPTHIERLWYLGKITIVSLALIAALLGPFWVGPHTLDASLDQDHYFLASFSTFAHDIASNQITLENAKLLGRVLFGVIYLYALYLSTKSFSHLLKAAFLALFFFLAFANGKFEPWYAIWPTMLAILIARIDETIVITVFISGATLSAAIYEYLWVWLGLTDSTLNVSDSLAYIMSFMPATTLLTCFILKRIFANSKQPTERHKADVEGNHTSLQVVSSNAELYL